MLRPSPVTMSLIRAKLASKFISRRYTRKLSFRAAAVLSAVDLPISGEEIPGLYDGRWRGTGDVVKSICPTTGEVLASVTTVRATIYTSLAAARSTEAICVGHSSRIP